MSSTTHTTSSDQATPSHVASVPAPETQANAKKSDAKKTSGAALLKEGMATGAGLGLTVVGVSKGTHILRDLDLDKIPTSSAEFAAAKEKYTALTNTVSENIKQTGLLKRFGDDIKAIKDAGNDVPADLLEKFTAAENYVASQGGAKKIALQTPGKGMLIASMAFVGGQAILAWDKVAEKVRQVAPAWLVNHSTQLHSTMRNLADITSTASAFWDGQKNWDRVKANAISVLALLPGIFYKEKPQTREELDAYDKMGMGEYAVTKVKEAFNPKEHIRETIGMATIGNGIFNSISGYKASPFTMGELGAAFKETGALLLNKISGYKGPKITAGGIEKYKYAFEEIEAMRPFKMMGKSSSELIAGVLTVTAGLLITFVKESDRAWQLSTAVFMGRVPAKWHQSHQEYFHGKEIKVGRNADGVMEYRHLKEGNYWQYVGFGLQQVANTLSSTMAGAHKDPITGQIFRPGDTHETPKVEALPPVEVTQHVKGRPGIDETVTEGSRAGAETSFAQREAEKVANKEKIQPKSHLEHAASKDEHALAI